MRPGLTMKHLHGCDITTMLLWRTCPWRGVMSEQASHCSCSGSHCTVEAVTVQRHTHTRCQCRGTELHRIEKPPNPFEAPGMNMPPNLGKIQSSPCSCWSQHWIFLTANTSASPGYDQNGPLFLCAEIVLLFHATEMSLLFCFTESNFA